MVLNDILITKNIIDELGQDEENESKIKLNKNDPSNDTFGDQIPSIFSNTQFY
jgi:hypothetical protein